MDACMDECTAACMDAWIVSIKKSASIRRAYYASKQQKQILILNIGSNWFRSRKGETVIQWDVKGHNSVSSACAQKATASSSVHVLRMKGDVQKAEQWFSRMVQAFERVRPRRRPIAA